MCPVVGKFICNVTFSFNNVMIIINCVAPERERETGSGVVVATVIKFAFGSFKMAFISFSHVMGCCVSIHFQFSHIAQEPVAYQDR